MLSSGFQDFLDNPGGVICVCLEGWNIRYSSLALPEKGIGEFGKFCYLNSYISPGGRKSYDVSPRKQKA